MDIGTIGGIALGLILVIIAILMGGSLGAFFNAPSLLIVFGGTIATMFIRFPMPTVFGSMAVVKNAFTVKDEKPEDLVKRIVELAEIARRESVLALDNVEINDSFLKRGVQLAVDGTDPSLIKSILMTELAAILERHKTGRKMFLGMGESAPAFGMIGTLIGLVSMLMAMDDPKSIGPAMAVALLTTLYGALLANLVCIPIANKLETRSASEGQLKKIALHGVDAIMAGTHPRVIEEKLVTFLPPAARVNAVKKKAA